MGQISNVDRFRMRICQFYSQLIILSNHKRLKFVQMIIYTIIRVKFPWGYSGVVGQYHHQRVLIKRSQIQHRAEEIKNSVLDFLNCIVRHSHTPKPILTPKETRRFRTPNRTQPDGHEPSIWTIECHFSFGTGLVFHL